MPYGIRLLECLLEAGCHVQLLYSQVAQVVANQEMAIELPSRATDAQTYFRERYAAHPGKLEVYGREEWFAPVASGSNRPDAMVICPCTMGTLASIAQGLAKQLIERAADTGASRNTFLGNSSGKHAASRARRRRHPASQPWFLPPSAGR